MHLTPQAYALVGLTAIVAALVTVVVFSMLRFSAAARETRRNLRTGGGADTALLSAALQEAVTKLKAQERATAARAEASERLSGEIISSLTEAMVKIEGENMRPVTWVIIEDVRSGEWGIGGQPMTTGAVQALASGKAQH